MRPVQHSSIEKTMPASGSQLSDTPDVRVPSSHASACTESLRRGSTTTRTLRRAESTSSNGVDLANLEKASAVTQPKQNHLKNSDDSCQLFDSASPQAVGESSITLSTASENNIFECDFNQKSFFVFDYDETLADKHTPLSGRETAWLVALLQQGKTIAIVSNQPLRSQALLLHPEHSDTPYLNGLQTLVLDPLVEHCRQHQVSLNCLDKLLLSPNAGRSLHTVVNGKIDHTLYNKPTTWEFPSEFLDSVVMLLENASLPLSLIHRGEEHIIYSKTPLSAEQADKLYGDIVQVAKNHPIEPDPYISRPKAGMQRLYLSWGKFGNKSRFAECAQHWGNSDHFVICGDTMTSNPTTGKVGSDYHMALPGATNWFVEDYEAFGQAMSSKLLQSNK